ncbi:hypothetical protein ScPMuIL_013361 [Solemya velum]
MMCGGVKAAQAATDEVKALCEQLKADMVSQAGSEFEEFAAISYSSQVVAGTNFFIKIKTGASDYIHARVHRPLPGQGEASLHSIQAGKTLEEPIAHF